LIADHGANRPATVSSQNHESALRTPTTDAALAVSSNDHQADQDSRAADAETSRELVSVQVIGRADVSVLWSLEGIGSSRRRRASTTSSDGLVASSVG
jgi:hypothetical protein